MFLGVAVLVNGLIMRSRTLNMNKNFFRLVLSMTQ